MLEPFVSLSSLELLREGAVVGAVIVVEAVHDTALRAVRNAKFFQGGGFPDLFHGHTP